MRGSRGITSYVNRLYKPARRRGYREESNKNRPTKRSVNFRVELSNGETEAGDVDVAEKKLSVSRTENKPNLCKSPPNS
ncbi:hypothetical protein GWI33_014965 [Rhynchophorus ferrugineus]|uniref:Uncharacterized protein n=1 Tax=Rhynchophorus ferrugineus TaxID=354439 RepID=A0A834I1K2_RHYFE|nr:hypothetical protein GWI33_014965 [Rhynchophorus ferrugineus]